MRIGYISLGNMGGALARRILASHRLTVWDIHAPAARAFGVLGAVVASSAAELARAYDVILTCLPRSSDVKQLILGEHGLGEGLAPGTLLIDQTSGDPAETRALAALLAERRVALIDAPVSGGVMDAVAGTIAVMVSGPDEHCRRAEPVLKAIGPNVFRCGDQVGDGQAMKLVNNLLSAGCRIAALGRKLGQPLRALVDAINLGPARNRTTQVTLQELADGRPTPTYFTLALMLKDMNQATQLGMSCGVPTTLTNIVRGVLQIGVNTMGVTEPLETAVDLVEAMAGTRIAGDELANPANSGSLSRAAPDPLTWQSLLDAPENRSVRIGFVGLGTMGSAPVRRLLRLRPVMVYDIDSRGVEALVAEGATAIVDLPTLARRCELIFTCLLTSTHVHEVEFGPGGLAEGLHPGQVIVDQTTGDPAMTRDLPIRLQVLGVGLVDAPVSGGPSGAAAGSLAILCGGPLDALSAAVPVLRDISSRLVPCGPCGQGHVAKLLSNALSTTNCLLTYEAASIAVRHGLRLADLEIVINSSTGRSAASQRILPAAVERRCNGRVPDALGGQGPVAGGSAGDGQRRAPSALTGDYKPLRGGVAAFRRTGKHRRDCRPVRGPRRLPVQGLLKDAPKDRFQVCM
jgi:3-hydroxyisobutyrate dehydrogenase